jgi:hypothetical protein
MRKRTKSKSNSIGDLLNQPLLKDRDVASVISKLKDVAIDSLTAELAAKSCYSFATRRRSRNA